jgi:hypothetical protein
MKLCPECSADSRYCCHLGGTNLEKYDSEFDKKESLPADYKACGECGFDHSYDWHDAAVWHATH